MNASKPPMQLSEQPAKAESALNKFFTLSLDLFCTSGKDGYFQQMNPAWEKVLGWTESELRSRPWIEFVDPDEVEVTLNAERLCSQEDLVEYENRYRHKDGSYRWLSWRVSRAEDGVFYRVAKDITAAKQAEEELSKLRESDRRFRAVFNQTFQFCSLLNLDGTVLQDNQTALDFCQLEPEDIVGRPFWDVRCWTISPETQERLRSAIAQAAAGNVVRYEADILAPDDTVVTIDFSLKPLLDESGRVELLMAEGRDLMERKRVEQDLQRVVDELSEWQNRYKAASQINGLLLYEWNSQTEEIVWCENVEQVYGYSREELTGSSEQWMELIHPDDVENVMQKLERALATKEPLHIEYRMRQKDGSYITIEDKGQFYPDSAGNLTRMVGFVANISERKQAQEALRESEERWQLALQGNNDGIWDLDIKNNRVFYSARWKEMLGYEDHEIPNQSDEWTKRVHPDDIGWVTQACQEHVQGKTPYFIAEYRMQCKDGSYKWILDRGQALQDDAGNLVRIIGSHTDITERKQAEALLEQVLSELEMKVEERTTELKQANEQLQAEIAERQQTEAALRQSEELFRRVFDESPIGIALCQLERGFIRVNQAYAQMLGYTESELLSLSFKDVTHPQDLELEIPYLERAINGEIDGYQLEKRYIKKNQEIVWVNLTCVQIRDEAGKILYCLAMVEDITERKQAEAALRQSEELFRRIFDESPIGMALCQLERGFVRVNQAYAQMLGYTESELLSLSFKDVTYPQDLELEIPYLERAINREIDGYQLEKRYIKKNQEIVWVKLTCVQIRDEAGKILYCLAMVEDITERKQAEAALLHSEEQFRRVFDEAPIGMSLAGMDNKYIRVNRAFFEMLGYTQSELMALSFLDITHPEDLELEIPSMEQIKKGENDRFSLEKRYLTKNREIIWVNLTLIALRDHAGEVLYTLAMIEDITERKHAEEALRQSEARFRAIVEDQTELICRFKPDGTLTFVNDAYCHYFNMQCSELIGHSFMPIIPEEDQESVNRSFSSLSIEKPIVTYEHRVIQPSGEIRWQQWTDRALFDDSGQLIEIQAVGRDITKLKQAEADILKALEKERELSELRSGFVSLVSHEFRTPLTTIQSSAELLERYNKKLSDEKKQNHHRRIQTAVKRMTQLLEDILTIGKAEAGKLNFEPYPIDLVAFCRDLVESLQMSVQQSHNLKFEVVGDCTDAQMDEKLLGHILTNLLSNAMKYSPEGGTVQFDLICNQESAVFRIQDSGIGIPPEDIERLFESFGRASNVGNIPGTGLGLAIVQRCVDLHGGQIVVESEVGAGTTFTVTLPLR